MTPLSRFGAVLPVILLLGLLLGIAPLRAQTAGSVPHFGAAEVGIITEWKGQDRGDGSGSYELVTTATDRALGIAIEIRNTIERSADGEETTEEERRVMEGKTERAKGNLGTWSEAAEAWVAPFQTEFAGAARKNYRPNDKRVKEIVISVVPEAKVSTRAASDGRTVADVEVPGTHPADDLASRFQAIRQAFRDADVGLAKLRIHGTASAPTE